METYVGQYELSPGFVITVSKDGTQLKAKATNQEEYRFDPKSESIFYADEANIQISFNLDKDGQVISLTLLAGGQESTALKLNK